MSGSTPADTTQVEIFADELLDCADPATPNFVIVSADATSSLRLMPFKELHPDRVFQMGVAEGCAVATAFGLSRTNLKAFVIGYANFLIMRGLEVIRSYLAYHRADVTILGGMTGLTASYDGFMHQAIEDVGLMRALDGMEILVPSDEPTTRAAARACVESPGPRYVRLVRREVHLPPALGAIGPLSWRYRDGQDALLVSFGPLLAETIDAARSLEADGLHASVLEVGRVAPPPRDELAEAAAPFARVVVVEDHLAESGLGAMVADALADTHRDIRRVGLTSRSAGSGHYEDVLREAGLTPSRIAAAATADR